LIRVVVDDLGFLEVDAVVRPANDTLEPVSSASVRLDHLAGEELRSQRRVHAALEVGSAVVTAGGDLAAPFVLHIVIRSQAENVTRAALARALSSAWHRAAEWELARVALPLVGTGAGQLSPEDAVVLLVESLQQVEAGGHPQDVLLVVDGEREREEVEGLVSRASS